MNGWIEWPGFLIGMVVAGIGVLAFFTVPLLVLIAGAAAGSVWWFMTAQPSRAPRVERRDPER